jgi:hypothetical protein
LIEKYRDKKGENQLKRDKAEREDECDSQRFPEERILGEHLPVILGSNPFRWSNNIPLGETDNNRSNHWTENKEQESYRPWRGEDVEVSPFFLEEMKTSHTG